MATSLSALNIKTSLLSPTRLQIHVHLRFVIFFLVAVLFTSALFAQDKTQPTVDELVAKNIEAKGGATTLQNLQSLRAAGKLLVQHTTAKKDGESRRSSDAKIPSACPLTTSKR